MFLSKDNTATYELCNYPVFHRDLNEASNLNITYTAMHGVGAKYEAAAFCAFSLKPFFSTEEQVLFLLSQTSLLACCLSNNAVLQKLVSLSFYVFNNCWNGSSVLKLHIDSLYILLFSRQSLIQTFPQWNFQIQRKVKEPWYVFVIFSCFSRMKNE